jgi:uncharacterized membrane protein
VKPAQIPQLACGVKPARARHTHPGQTSRLRPASAFPMDARPPPVSSCPMTPAQILSAFTLADIAAVALLLVAALATGLLIEHPPRDRRSVSALMADYRREWMRQIPARDGRIFDATILTNLRQGTAFFASTVLISIGGVLALVGNTTPLQGLAEDIALQDAPALLWQIKLLTVVAFLAQAFLKFVWSNRIFGYCAVMMAAIPLDPTDPLGPPRAIRAGELLVRAAINFNRGLRAVYYAIAALGWLLGPWALMLTTLLITATLLSREFASASRNLMTGEDLR